MSSMVRSLSLLARVYSPGFSVPIGMAVRALELAQRRIAASIAALKRLLAKPPPPAAPRPPTR